MNKRILNDSCLFDLKCDFINEKMERSIKLIVAAILLLCSMWYTFKQAMPNIAHATSYAECLYYFSRQSFNTLVLLLWGIGSISFIYHGVKKTLSRLEIRPDELEVTENNKIKVFDAIKDNEEGRNAEMLLRLDEDRMTLEINKVESSSIEKDTIKDDLKAQKEKRSGKGKKPRFFQDLLILDKQRTETLMSFLEEKWRAQDQDEEYCLCELAEYYHALVEMKLLRSNNMTAYAGVFFNNNLSCKKDSFARKMRDNIHHMKCAEIHVKELRNLLDLD